MGFFIPMLVQGATSLAKAAIKKKNNKSKAKKFVSGKEQKGAGGAGGISGRGSSIVKGGSSAITPFVPVSDTSTDKVKVKPVSKVSFSSIAGQLSSIVSLSGAVEASTGIGLKTKKKKITLLKRESEKDKKRKRENAKEGFSIPGGGILGRAAGAVKGSSAGASIWKFFSSILMGIGALAIVNNIGKISLAFELFTANLHKVWLGIKGIGLVFKGIRNRFPSMLGLAGRALKKVVSPFTWAFRKLGGFVGKLFKGIGNKLITFVGKTWNWVTGGGQALSSAGGRGAAAAAQRRAAADAAKAAKGTKGLSNAAPKVSNAFRNIAAKHGDEAARMYQGLINNGVSPTRAARNVNKAIAAGKLTSIPSKLTSVPSKLTKGTNVLKNTLAWGKRVKFFSRIPIIGPLIVGIVSYMETGKLDQSLFRAGGALIGGFLGTFIPVPILGTLLGELVGEYIGDLFYILLKGGGPEALGKKLKEDMVALLSAGEHALNWLKKGFGRFYEGIPKKKVFALEFPDPFWFINPINVIEKAKLFWKAFFTDDPMQGGEVTKAKKEKEKESTKVDDTPSKDFEDILAEAHELHDPQVGLLDVYGEPLNLSNSALSHRVPTANLQTIGAGTGSVGKTSGRGMRDGNHHAGVDIGTSGQKGWHVAFKLKGKVSLVKSLSGYGKTVIINSGNLDFLFAHLASYNVREGQQYNGEIIGEIGNTGASRGVHLHFEVRSKDGGSGTDIDPNPYIKYLEIGMMGNGGNVPTTSLNVTKSPSSNIVPSSPSSFSPQSSPSSKTSSIESQTYYEIGGGNIIMMPPSSSPGGGGGGARGSGGSVIGSGDVLNSYYKAQLLGFLYKFG